MDKDLSVGTQDGAPGFVLCPRKGNCMTDVGASALGLNLDLAVADSFPEGGVVKFGLVGI